MAEKKEKVYAYDAQIESIVKTTNFTASERNA